MSVQTDSNKSTDEYKKRSDEALRKIMSIRERAQKEIDSLNYKKLLIKIKQ
jgi:hypothetical protein